MSDIDWNHYSLVGHTETWKVVCLSLGINPKDVEVETDHYATMLSNPIQKITPKRNKYKGDLTQKEIDNRYEIIEKRKFDGDYYYNDYTIDIEKFVKFANQIKISLPYEFKNLFEVQSINFKLEATDKHKATWKIKPLVRHKTIYASPLDEVLNEYLATRLPPPTALQVLQEFYERKPTGITVDLDAKTFSYLTHSSLKKTVTLKNLADVISRRVDKT